MTSTQTIPTTMKISKILKAIGSRLFRSTPPEPCKVSEVYSTLHRSTPISDAYLSTRPPGRSALALPIQSKVATEMDQTAVSMWAQADTTFIAFEPVADLTNFLNTGGSNAQQPSASRGSETTMTPMRQEEESHETGQVAFRMPFTSGIPNQDSTQNPNQNSNQRSNLNDELVRLVHNNEAQQVQIHNLETSLQQADRRVSFLRASCALSSRRKDLRKHLVELESELDSKNLQLDEWKAKYDDVMMEASLLKQNDQKLESIRVEINTSKCLLRDTCLDLKTELQRIERRAKADLKAKRSAMGWPGWVEEEWDGLVMSEAEAF